MTKNRAKLSSLCLILLLGLTACGKKNGNRNLGLSNDELAGALEARPGSALDNGALNPGGAGPAQPSGDKDIDNDCTDCDSDGNKLPKNATVLGTIEDDIRRQEYFECDEKVTSSNDFDLDGLTDKCEYNLGSNPQCYNGYLISGVLLDKQVIMKIPGVGGWFSRNVFSLGSQNRWVDKAIERLTRLNSGEAMSMVKTIYKAHWDANERNEGASRRDKKKKGGGAEYPFRMKITPENTLEHKLLRGGKIEDDIDFNQNQSEEQVEGKYDIGIAIGDRAEPILTDPVENGPGKITAIEDSSDRIQGQGGYMVFSEAYLTKPGYYRFFTGVLLADGQVQYTQGRGNYFVVTVGQDTVLTSSMDLAARGKASVGDPTDKRTKGFVKVSSYRDAKHLMIASIVREQRRGGSYINDNLFVQYLDLSGKVDTQTKAGTTADVLTFMRQDYAQIASGYMKGTERESILQKPLWDNLKAFSEDSKFGTQIEKTFYKGCSMDPADAYAQLANAKGILDAKNKAISDEKARLDKLAADQAAAEKKELDAAIAQVKRKDAGKETLQDKENPLSAELEQKARDEMAAIAAQIEQTRKDQEAAAKAAQDEADALLNGGGSNSGKLNGSNSSTF